MTAILEQPENLLHNIKVVDMQKEMVAEAIKITSIALEKHEIETEIARHIKEYFDSKYEYLFLLFLVPIGIVLWAKALLLLSHMNQDIIFIFSMVRYQLFFSNLGDIYSCLAFNHSAIQE